MAGMFLPPGGLAGFSQMTPASRLALTKGTSSTGGRRRRRKAKKATRRASGKRRSTRKKKGPKFGSPAFQKLHKVGKYRRK